MARTSAHVHKLQDGKRKFVDREWHGLVVVEHAVRQVLACIGGG